MNFGPLYSHFFVKMLILRHIQYGLLRCVTICPVSPGYVGAIVNVIAVLLIAFGYTSAPFASAKGGDGPFFLKKMSTKSNDFRKFGAELV